MQGSKGDHRYNNAVVLFRVHASISNQQCPFEENNADRWITSEVMYVKDMSMLNSDGIVFLIGCDSNNFF